MAQLLTPDEYMDLLVQRGEQAHADNREEHQRRGLPPVREWVRPLAQQMIRPGDELLVDMVALTAQTARMEGRF